MALSEAELVTKIEILLQKKFNTELTFREISAGYGIADLVLASASLMPSSIKREPIVHFGTLKFFIELGKGRYTFDALHKLAPHTQSRDLKKNVNFLVNNGYLSIDTNGLYKKSNILDKQQPIKKIVAIEAKLTDYKNGILQARRYQYFADQSYLAILKKAAIHIDIDQLVQSGIGLILFDETTEGVEIIEPHHTTGIQEKVYRTFASELMLSRMCFSSAS